MVIYFCVLILVCFCVLCAVFVSLLNLGQEDEADGADGVDVDQGIENCGASSQPKSTQNNFLLKYKLERGIRDPERGMGDTGRGIREKESDNIFLSHPSYQERLKSAHIVYMLVYVYYNTNDDDDDVKTE